VTRRAVCIASNYEGTSSALAGCLNDAADWAAELDRRGYEVATLLGKDATKAGILGALERAVAATKYRDRLIVSWSGHGTWVTDRDGDEADGRDEAICPDDYARAGMVTDDDLFKAFSAADHGERVVMISDSCHSGTLNRFAGPIENVGPFGLGVRSAPSNVSEPVLLQPARLVRFLPPGEFLDDLDAARAVEHLPARGLMRRGALVLSACAAGQVTFDITAAGRPCGLFSHVALKALRSLPDGTSYREWHRLIGRALPSVDYPQVTPQLDGTSTQKRWDALA
jgi:hypothetical protein